MDDRELIERVRRGDAQAFASLYSRHQRAIYRYALHMCGTAAAADVVQDTFLAVLRQPRGYEPSRGPLAGYLLGIARHHVSKHLAQTRAESLLDDCADDSEMADSGSGVDPETPLDLMSRSELVAQVREAIQSLPAVYREAIALCELQEIDYATAAAIMQCPIGTVRSRIHRAKALLMTKLTALQLERAAPLKLKTSSSRSNP